MSTNGVNGASQTQRAQLVAQLNAASAKGDFAEVGKLSAAILKFDEDAKKAGTKVEPSNAQPLTAEEQAAKAKANQAANDEIAAMKAAAQSREVKAGNPPEPPAPGPNAPAPGPKGTEPKAPDPKAEAQRIINDFGSKSDAKHATDTEILKGQAKYDTKDEASAEFDVSGRKAKKIAKAATKNLEAMKSYEAVEKIYTNEDEYKAAVKKAKDDGTWDKDNPKYTLLDGKALEGAKRLHEKSKSSVNEALKSYHKYEEIYKNAATPADRNKAMYVMMKAAEYIQRDYNASQMFNEDGSVNKEAYQKTMLQYTGTDFKAGLDERKVLKGSAEVKKRTTKDMFEAAGLDVRKDYTGVMKAGAAALALGTGALTGLLGGGLIAQAVASATATATATASASASATATNHWTASNGEEFFDSVEATDFQTTEVTETVTKLASATGKISKGEMALRGAAGAILPAVIAAITVKDNGEKDIFKGASVDEVLSQKAKVSGKANQAIMDKILDMKITGDPNRDKEIKAAVLQTAIGERTGKSVNTRELLAAYEVANHISKHPELVEPEEASTPPTSTPTDTTPTVTTPPTTTPVDEDCYNVNEENVRSNVPVIKYGGPWHYSKLYVNQNGSNLSEPDRKALQKALSSGDNAIQNARGEDGKLIGRAMKNEITLPSGRVVVLAKDAVDRAKKLQGTPDKKARDRKYNTASDGKLMWATDCKTGKPISPKMTPAQFDEWVRLRAEKE